MISQSPVDTDTLVRRFRITDRVPISDQVSDFLRGLIKSGALPAGHRVPSIRVLAKRWGVNPGTVQTGMSRLVGEGLLFRIMGRGMCVQNIPKKLSCVGLYELAETEFNQESRSLRILFGQLRRLLADVDIESRTFVDDRKDALRDNSPFPNLLRAFEQGDIQGLIAMVSNATQIEWIQKLPWPLSILGRGHRPNVVEGDYLQAMTLALRDLASRGCRSVGVISTMATRSPDRLDDAPGVYTHMLDMADELKMQIRNQWVHAPEQEPLRGQTYEQFGYERTKKLWGEAERPDGLYVTDDYIAKGVILALTELRIRVPDELKLVFFRVKETELFCPLPASFVEFSLQESAQAVIAHLQQQFDGQPAERILVPHHLVPSE